MLCMLWSRSHHAAAWSPPPSPRLPTTPSPRWCPTWGCATWTTAPPCLRVRPAGACRGGALGDGGEQNRLRRVPRRALLPDCTGSLMAGALQPRHTHPCCCPPRATNRRAWAAGGRARGRGSGPPVPAPLPALPRAGARGGRHQVGKPLLCPHTCGAAVATCAAVSPSSIPWFTCRLPAVASWHYESINSPAFVRH